MAIRAKQSNATVMTECRELIAQSEALILRHTGLVRHIAYHLFGRRNYVDVGDLIEAGMVALLEAMRGRGHDTAGSFESFASTRIREAMLEFVRTSDWSARTPKSSRAARSRYSSDCSPLS
jgi:RNA polymerase sigma factor FliA